MEQPQSSGAMRLNRYLAQCGLGSRRSVETLIRAGRILVNGIVVVDLSTTVNPETDKVEHQGKELSNVRRHEYIAYHKPAGPIVTADDPEGRETVYDAISRDCHKSITHLRYVGRLDVNSEGLLLFTNDGDIIHALTHPRYHIKKVYELQLEGPLSDDEIRRMVEDGLESEGQVLHAGEVKAVTTIPGNWYQISLYEGKNRQIRRMMDALGLKVRRLRRIQFGPIRLGELPVCAMRVLGEREVAALRACGYPRKNP